MKIIALILVALLLASCMTPRAERYLAHCIEAGHGEAECRMRAEEIDMVAWQGISAAFRDFGTATARPAAPAVTTTNCHAYGSSLSCTSF